MVKDFTNKHYAIVDIAMILNVKLNFLHTLAKLMKQLLNANSLSTYSPPTHKQYRMQSFFIVKKIAKIIERCSEYNFCLSEWL